MEDLYDPTNEHLVRSLADHPQVEELFPVFGRRDEHYAGALAVGAQTRLRQFGYAGISAPPMHDHDAGNSFDRNLHVGGRVPKYFASAIFGHVPFGMGRAKHRYIGTEILWDLGLGEKAGCKEKTEERLTQNGATRHGSHLFSLQALQ